MKTVLITGSSRGIGAATAKLFAENGFNVVINYNKSAKQAENLLAEIISKGGTAVAIKANVSSPTEVSAMIDEVNSRFGGVDVLVNNAGISSQRLFTDISEEEWAEFMNVNLGGVFRTTKAVLPKMINKKSGKIINVSSIWGITGASCEVHYSTAKAAIIGFTKALAKEVGPSGIT
ncbi:MAG: SDR family NAD(P)-dependent oxidoreductase, partial [Oscillospiraceae bacterium]